MTGANAAYLPRGPHRVDAALRDTIALLELVRHEGAVLARLRGCLAELEAIRRARATLADRTATEIAEAGARSCDGLNVATSGVVDGRCPQ